MTIKPKSFQQAIELKMAELGMNQAKLREEFCIGAPKLSQILSRKREPDVDFLKAAHQKLHIDAAFLLTHTLSRLSYPYVF